jgi:hypothetical protein
MVAMRSSEDIARCGLEARALREELHQIALVVNAGTIARSGQRGAIAFLSKNLTVRFLRSCWDGCREGAIARSVALPVFGV